MNSIKWIKNNLDLAKKNAEKRGVNPLTIVKVINLSSKINSENEKISGYLHNVKFITSNNNLPISKKKEKIKELKYKIEEERKKLTIINDEYKTIMDSLPNLDLLHYNEPPVILVNDKKRKKQSLPHWKIYEHLNLVNFQWGINVGGRRFVVYVGKGAKLRRAIMNFQTEIAIKNGFIEVLPPVIATNESMYNSGHFPKFKKDVFQLKDRTHCLVGSVETSICNFFVNSILRTSSLPKRFVCTTLNFRSEVGSAGRDVKGCNRIKQFTKTELFSFTIKEKEKEEFERMKNTALKVLNAFELPYRISTLSPKDISFSSRKTIDLEVWLPSENLYKEVSSISLVGNFQARRGLIRHRESINHKTTLCSTLNGTAIAVDRIMAALVETFYDEKNNIIVLPPSLVPYFGEKIIS